MPVGGDSIDKFCYKCNTYVSMVYMEEEEDYVCLDCLQERYLAEQEEKDEAERAYDNL